MYSIGQVFERVYPPEAAIWCNNNNAIMADLGSGNFQIQALQRPSLVQTKEAKKIELNAKRDEVEQAGFIFDGSVFDSDIKSYNRLVGASLTAQVVLAAGQPYSVEWTLQDNTIRTLSAEEVLQIIPTFAIYSNSLHQKTKALKELVDQALTVEEVDKITWS